MKGKAYVILAGLLAAALFLFLFFALGWNPVVCVLLSVGAYFGLFFLLKPARGDMARLLPPGTFFGGLPEL